MKLVKIFVEKRTLQEEITMKNKLKKALCLGLVHIAKLNGRICGAKRSHSVFEQPNCYQSV